jgi:hypothetical protein
LENMICALVTFIGLGESQILYPLCMQIGDIIIHIKLGTTFIFEYFLYVKHNIRQYIISSCPQSSFMELVVISLILQRK